MSHGHSVQYHNRVIGQTGHIICIQHPVYQFLRIITVEIVFDGNFRIKKFDGFFERIRIEIAVKRIRKIEVAQTFTVSLPLAKLGDVIKPLYPVAETPIPETFRNEV